jgi:putative Mn2+ efflux pump MntP
VTLFAVGHSTTLLLGVLAGWHVDAYLVDAVIGLSVVYKAFENLGGFRRLGFEPNTKAAVLFFGFFHGLGLATKLQDLALSRDGLVANMVSFNVGVEIGQLAIVLLVASALAAIRRYSHVVAYRVAFAGSVVVIAAGTYWFVERVFFQAGA